MTFILNFKSNIEAKMQRAWPNVCDIIYIYERPIA